jgi:hypothetical protein
MSANVEQPEVCFLNRDHIVLVTIGQGEIVVNTTAVTKITIPASAATLAKFVDDLANHVESNFVSIASPQVSISLRGG